MKTKSVELPKDAETRNQIANKVENIEVLFKKVLEQAVAKQHSVEKAAVQLQRLDTGIKNLSELVEEIESMLSFQKNEMSDAKLRESIELYQVCLNYFPK